MLITDVRMGTADLASAERFYRDALELPVTRTAGAVVVTVGRSTLTLVEHPALTESNHLAFTIPSNRFADAKAWLASRVELMRWEDDVDELRLGEPWDSESVYFRGPDGIILEAITRQRLDNASDEDFSSAQFLCVSEVGLATPNVSETFAEVRREFGVDTFAGESPDFTTVGDQDGLLILVTDGRPWFPTRDVHASTESLYITIRGAQPGVVESDGWTVRSNTI
jgi:catechol-2,3-dioxygenase